MRHVLEELGDLYVNDTLAREQGMMPEERLRFYQLYSGPVMDQLHIWLTAQFAEKKVEPNSGLGVAMRYLLKHWERLTLFLRQPGAPLDNCLVSMHPQTECDGTTVRSCRARNARSNGRDETKGWRPEWKHF